MKLNRIIVALAIVAVASSCGITKKYERPAQASEILTESIDSLEQESVEWSQFFHDEKLIALIDKAMDGNYDLQNAASRILEAEAYFRKSKAAMVPTMGVSVKGGVSHPAKSTALPSPQYSAEMALTSTWDLGLWGKLRSAKRSQYASLLASRAAYGVVSSELVAQVASLYYQLVAADMQLAVVDSAIHTRKESLRTLEVQMESGYSNQIGVSQASAQLYYAESLRPSILANIDLLENSLRLLLGDRTCEISRSATLDLAMVDVMQISGKPLSTLALRADVQQAEQQLRAAHEQYNVARASLYPSITLTASVGATGINWIDLPSSVMGSVIGSLVQPIFNHGALRAAERAGEQQKIQATNNFLKVVDAAYLEVGDNITLLDKRTEESELLAKQEGELNKATVAALQLLRNGYATYLDLLTAQQQQLSAAQQAINARLAATQAAVNLYKSVGGGCCEYR